MTIPRRITRVLPIILINRTDPLNHLGGESGRPPRFPRWGLRLVGERAVGDTVGIYRAADGHRAAGAASACADAVGSTVALRGGQAGHSFCNRDVTACATITRTDSGGTSSFIIFTAS